MNEIQQYQTSSSLVATPSAIAEHRMRADVLHYKQIPPKTRIQWLANKMAEMCTLRHQDCTIENLVIDATTLDETIMEHPIISDYTLDEITIAFRKGLFGQFGDFYGVTAISCYMFLEKWLKTPEKQEAIKLVRMAKGMEPEQDKEAVERTFQTIMEMSREAKKKAAEREREEAKKKAESLAETERMLEKELGKDFMDTYKRGREINQIGNIMNTLL